MKFMTQFNEKYKIPAMARIKWNVTVGKFIRLGFILKPFQTSFSSREVINVCQFTKLLVVPRLTDSKVHHHRHQAFHQHRQYRHLEHIRASPLPWLHCCTVAKKSRGFSYPLTDLYQGQKTAGDSADFELCWLAEVHKSDSSRSILSVCPGHVNLER